MGRQPEKKGGGESHRTARVEKEIRDVVGMYLVNGMRQSDLPGLISLTRVSVSADLKIANINVTMIMSQLEGEEPLAFEKREALARKDAIKVLNANSKDVQAALARKLQMRFTPRVTFYYDEGFESALKVEKILRDMSVAGGREDEGVPRPSEPLTVVRRNSDDDSDDDSNDERSN